jgi:glucosamine-6-phosphate deaminase
MPAEVRVFADAGALGAALADEVRERHAASGGPFLLGCPAGRSLVTTYRALAGRGGLDRLVVVMMDEYAGAPVEAHYSCRGFALRELAGPLGLEPDRLWVPDEADPAAYDARIAAAGGIDLFLLASGASDGHVAFNGPGSPLDGGTRVVRLAESTRRDNVATFPGFASADEVPEHGVSVGLGTIAAARAARLVLHGAEKRAAARRVTGAEAFDPDWPATVIHTFGDGEIWLDEAAAG